MTFKLTESELKFLKDYEGIFGGNDSLFFEQIYSTWDKSTVIDPETGYVSKEANR